MDNLIKSAFERVGAARPASGFRPETESEWNALQAALLELGYAMFHANGMSAKKARELATTIYGGVAGRLLIELAFKDQKHD